MTSRKRKKKVSFKGDFTLTLKNNSAHQRSSTIRIGPQFRIDASPPSISRRMENISPQEVASLKRKERVPKNPTNNVQSMVTLNQMDEANL